MVQEPKPGHAIVFAVDREFPVDENDADIMAAIHTEFAGWMVAGVNEVMTWADMCQWYPRIAANNFTMHCLHGCKKEG